MKNTLTLIIHSHNPAWANDFVTEANLIRAALGACVVDVHHIGSTAVGGLCAKPIIDLMAEVGSLDALDAQSAAMERLGYEVMGEFGIPGRRYFRKDNAAGQRTHQLHAFAVGSPHIERHLAFRDYLRAQPEAARDYGALKMRLLETCNGDLETYIAGKDAFVKNTERAALEWARGLQR